MKYNNMKAGIFRSRPNRFIAFVEIDGIEEICHVKNTGRCKELLIPGVKVYVQEHDNPSRKTRFSVIAVEKRNRLINMDSQAPNKVVLEWIQKGGLFQDVTYIKPEKTFGDSRLDLYVEASNKKIYIEVKGVTLEEDGIVRFPDAPTERGIKHLKELCECRRQGYEAYLIFVVQMSHVNHFEPNDKTHSEFGEALRQAREQGVCILAYDCEVDFDKLEIGIPVTVDLKENRSEITT
jgi:sugar fermentation stimulation protein A